MYFLYSVLYLFCYVKLFDNQHLPSTYRFPSTVLSPFAHILFHSDNHSHPISQLKKRRLSQKLPKNHQTATKQQC